MEFTVISPASFGYTRDVPHADNTSNSESNITMPNNPFFIKISLSFFDTITLCQTSPKKTTKIVKLS